jgi:hypothetical protein
LITAVTSSGRPVHYLKLDLLNGHELFKDQDVYLLHPSVRQLVAELGGHPRSLISLGEVLESAAFKEKYPIGKHIPFAVLLNALGDHVNLIGSSPESDEDMDAVIDRCLLGAKVGLDESVVANGHTYSYYISEVRLLSLFLSFICWVMTSAFLTGLSAELCIWLAKKNRSHHGAIRPSSILAGETPEL